MTREGGLQCLFREFHNRPNGREGNKDLSRLISRLKRLHLNSEERKSAIREALKSDHGQFCALEETLRVLEQWVCERCMSIQVMSRACHHHDGVVHVTDDTGEGRSLIVGILNLSAKAHDISVAKERLILNAELVDKVFRASITTVKSIPNSYRLAFSQAPKATLLKEAAESCSLAYWVRLLLLSHCTLQVFMPKNRRDRRSGCRKSLQQPRILSSLAIYEETDGIDKLIERVLDSSEGNMGHKEDTILEEETTNTNIRQCLRKFVYGHFTAAVKVLCSYGVALYNAYTIKDLEAKHPYKTPPSKPSSMFSEAPLLAEVDTVLGCIKSFSKGTSCDRDGLWAQYILDAIRGEGSVVAKDLLHAITPVVNLWLGVRCPWSLAEVLASAPLTPLLKPDNGIRPIAVGIIWRCLVSNVAMK